MNVVLLIGFIVSLLFEPQMDVADQTQPTTVVLPDGRFEIASGSVEVTADGIILHSATLKRLGAAVVADRERSDAHNFAVREGEIEGNIDFGLSITSQALPCWNVGSLSSEALATTVVVAVSLTQDGKPQMETIRMVSHSGGGEGAAQQAFEAARRAIIRCGAKGYSLPADKYDRWRNIEMTFNPERMRIK